MAAALLQYQACLGIMVRLQLEDLNLLKQDFDRMGRGLSLEEFVSVMLDRVSWEQENVVKFIEDLVELFAQVDVNGDGSMEWEEFTSAIIEGGMGTNSDEADWRDLQYEEHPRFSDSLNRPPKRVQLVPEFRRLLLYENTRPVVEIIEPSTLFPSEGDGSGSGSTTTNGSGGGDRSGVANSDPTLRHSVAASGGSDANGASMFTPTLNIVNNFHPLCYIAGYRRDQDEVRSERSPVQALKYLNAVELLAVSAGDLRLTFWSTTILTATSTSALETPVPMAVVHTPRPQRVLEWDASAQHLFSISADLVITVWLVQREKHHDAKGRCEVTLVTTLKKHTDLLQDLLVLNSETLVSCGMDNMIYLWDTQSLQVKAVRQGHRRGVRLLTKLSNQIFLSAGFECEVLGWDISALATTPVFKLWGHTSPVCCIQLISSSAFASLHERRMSTSTSSASAAAATAAAFLADQAITVDDEGWFKWWNLANILSIENNDLEKSNSRCLQTFRIGGEKYPWKAHSLVVLNNGQSIVAAGLHKLKLLQRVRLKPKILASSVVLYNSVSFTLLTTTDKEIRIWDASSGTLIRTYRNITTSDITCVDLDARQRKIVFGTQNGELFVLNYLNGAILKQWTPHQLQVSALLYCKEDQCVLTASWDRSLRLYDDNADTNSLLRCITDAHDTDIKCLAYCYPLGLFASGSTDGTIKIWDYIYFLLEDACTPATGEAAATANHGIADLASHSMPASDVNVLEFVEPYPLLLSGHENGMVCIWNLSPSQPTTLLLCFHPLLLSPAPPVLSSSSLPRVGTNGPETPASSSPPSKRVKGGSVSCCQAFYDEEGGDLMANDIRRGRFLLLIGSNHGEICISDVSSVIAKSYVRAFREESLPSHHHRSYNPRRRFLRQGKNAKRLRSKHSSSSNNHDSEESGDGHSHQQQQVAASDVACVAKWTAHQGNIRCLRTVEEPRAILTCASDKHVRVWDFEGTCLGNLTSGGQPQKASDGGGAPNGSATWQWEIDLATTAQAKQAQAQEIWNEMKASKLKSVAVARHQSAIAATRERRRSSAQRLSTSASVPALGLPSEQSEQQQLLSGFSSKRNSRGDASISHSRIHEEDDDDAERESTSEADRLFDQLHGKATWKQSDFQLARQVAWERERKKFQQRMKAIMKSKSQANKKSTKNNQQQSSGQRDQTESEPLVDTHEEEAVLMASADASVLPVLENPVQELPFADKDNWAVGSLNREKQMYTHLHHENVRRNQKNLVSSSSGTKLRKMQSREQLDLAPSTFLLEKLGATCLVLENQPPKHRAAPRSTKKKPLHGSTTRHTRSSPALPLAGRPTTAGQDQEPMAPPVAPHRSMQQLLQQYDQLLQQQQAEREQLHRASVLLTSAAPLKTVGERRGSSGQQLPPSPQQDDPNHNDNNAHHLKKISSAPVNRAPSSTPTGRAVSSAKATRASPNATATRNKHATPEGASTAATTETETPAEKKLRMRADAALLRQERFGPYSRDDVVNIYRTFHKIDQDQSGSITLRELLDGAGLFDGMHLQENIMSIFSSIDVDRSGHIDLQELCTAIFGAASPGVLREISRLCQLLDAAEKAKKAKKKQLSTEQLKELNALFQVSGRRCVY